MRDDRECIKAIADRLGANQLLFIAAEVIEQRAAGMEEDSATASVMRELALRTEILATWAQRAGL